MSGGVRRRLLWSTFAEATLVGLQGVVMNLPGTSDSIETLAIVERPAGDLPTIRSIAARGIR